MLTTKYGQKQIVLQRSRREVKINTSRCNGYVVCVADYRLVKDRVRQARIRNKGPILHPKILRMFNLVTTHEIVLVAWPSSSGRTDFGSMIGEAATHLVHVSAIYWAPASLSNPSNRPLCLSLGRLMGDIKRKDVR